MKVQQVNTQQTFGMRKMMVDDSIREIKNAPRAILDAYQQIIKKGDAQTDIIFAKHEPIDLRSSNKLSATVTKKIEAMTTNLFGKYKTIKIEGFATCPCSAKDNKPLTEKEIIKLTDQALASLQQKIQDSIITDLLKEASKK